MADQTNVTQDTTLWDDARTKSVDVVTDGSTERLAVDAKITNSVSTVARYTPKFYSSTTDIAINSSTDTTLATITADGQVDFVSVTFDSNDVEIVLECDSTEIFRENIADIDGSGEFDLRHSSSHSHCVYTRGGAHVVFEWPTPADFTTNFVVKAGDKNASMSSIMIRYREAI